MMAYYLRKHLGVTILSVLCVVGLAGLAALLVYQHIIWTEPVDSYTFIEQRADGQVISAIMSHDAAAATHLRQTINDLPRVQHVVTCSHTLGNAPSPANQFTYIYIFYLHGLPIETVTGLTNDCTVGSIQCRGDFAPTLVAGVPNTALRESAYASVPAQIG